MPRFTLPAALVAVAFFALPLIAAADSGFQSGDFHIATDETNYNLNNGDFTMPHHITASRPGTEISGDRAHGNSRRHMIVITGNVTVHQTGPVSAHNSQVQSAAQQPSTLTANAITVDWGQHQYAADGNVRFTQGLRTVTADHGTLNDFTHQLNLQGNVHIEEGTQTMDAGTVDYNTQTEDVKAKGNVNITAPADMGPLPGTVPGSAAKTGKPGRP